MRFTGDWLRRVLAFMGNVRVLSITSLLGGASIVMLRTMLQPFVLSLGASMAFLGTLEALGGHGGVITSLIQPAGGWLSDRRGRKLLVILGSVLSLMALAFSTIASYSNDWTWLVPAIITLGLSAVNLPAVDSTVAESVEMHERSRAYSVLMFFTIPPGIFASSIGGFIADEFGYAPLFLIGTLLQGFSLFLILRFMRELARSSQHRMVSTGKIFWGIFISNGRIERLLLGDSLRRLCLGPRVCDITWALRKTYNFSNFQLGIIGAFCRFLLRALSCPWEYLLKNMDARGS